MLCEQSHLSLPVYPTVFSWIRLLSWRWNFCSGIWIGGSQSCCSSDLV